MLTQDLSPAALAAPDLPYLPRDPRHYRPRIGLIGCGMIAQRHLPAYRQAGYEIAALSDCAEAKAHALREEFYPQAQIYADYRELLSRDDLDVVDIATHPDVRGHMIEDALLAGKHVLSQKPFVTDLDEGQRLVELAERKGLKLAVNQNARWAPHFSYMRQAVAHGMIGEVLSVHASVHWDHNWIAGTAFDAVKQAILYDFAIHWFDMLICLMGERPARRVYASLSKAKGQQASPPLLAQALVEFDSAQASLVFDGSVPVGSLDQTIVTGTRGLIHSSGPELNAQKLTLRTEQGVFTPELQGSWFYYNGFHGAMGELLCAIEEGGEPDNSARNNLRSLELSFAAILSSISGRAQTPGQVRRLPTTDY